jgi:regulatory protein
MSDEIDTTVNNLKKLNYINDLEFARAFAKEKVKFRNIGPLLLRSELIRHYIETALIDRIIQEIYDKYDIHTLIEKHLEKKSINKGSSLENAIKQKLDNYLRRKGFSWGQINVVYADWGLI